MCLFQALNASTLPYHVLNESELAMGQINLFAPTLTDTMHDFIIEHREGLLRPIGAIRILEEEGRLRCHLSVHALDYSYILMEATDPLIFEDINWLYRGIVAAEFEYDKRKAFRYAVERALTPPGAERKRTRMENDAEFEIVQRFRQCLELPAMAWRHYQKTHQPGGHINVERHNAILVIEYEEKPFHRP